MKVRVTGMGPGAAVLLTAEAEKAVREADIVLTSARLEEQLRTLNSRVEVMGVSETIAYIREHKDENMTVCAAASGDTGFYSIAGTISRQLSGEVDVEFICGIGSLSFFTARLQTGYEDLKLISLHGKAGSIVPYVCYNRRVFALTGGAIKAHDVAGELTAAGLGHVMLHIGENLSLPDERIVCGHAEKLAGMRFEDLAVVLVENDSPADPYRTLKDSDFVRGKVPMTKEAVRNLVVMALAIAPDDVVYDIGAGTGSVTCAMALRARNSFVCAIEKEKEAAALIRENMEKLGIRNIRLYEGTAPEGMENFPPADKVFIGGSSGNLRQIAEAALSRNEKAVLVITAVTLETLTEAVQVCRDLGLSSEILCANISAAQKLGRYHLMKAENPVYILKGERRVEE